MNFEWDRLTDNSTQSEKTYTPLSPSSPMSEPTSPGIETTPLQSTQSFSVPTSPKTFDKSKPSSPLGENVIVEDITPISVNTSTKIISKGKPLTNNGDYLNASDVEDALSPPDEKYDVMPSFQTPFVKVDSSRRENSLSPRKSLSKGHFVSPLNSELGRREFVPSPDASTNNDSKLNSSMIDDIINVTQYKAKDTFENALKPVQNFYISSYHINGETFDGFNRQLDKIYEDVLPISDGKVVFNTLTERLSLHSFMRNRSMINNHIGDLLAYFKLQGVDKSHGNYINPFTNTSDNLIVFNTMYPMHVVGSNAKEAKNAITINVRVYGSTTNGPNEKSMYSNYMSHPHQQQKSLYGLYGPQTLSQPRNDESLSISSVSYIDEHTHFYEYVTNKLVTRRKSPHFPMMYGAYNVKNNIKNPITFKTNRKPEMLNVMLTESPTLSLPVWSTNQYVNRSNIGRQTSSGLHSINEWYNLLFQITAAFHTMIEHDILISDCSSRNVYIKNTSSASKRVMQMHWRYVIDGYTFYVPSYDFVVMMEPNSTDSVVIGGNNKEMIFNQYLDIIKGIKDAPQQILDIINNDLIKTSGINDSIIMFDRYLNNRRGTHLNRDEIIGLNKTPLFDGQLKIGKMYAMRIIGGTYVWVIYGGPGRLITNGISVPNSNSLYMTNGLTGGIGLTYVDSSEPKMGYSLLGDMSVENMLDEYIVA